MRTLQRIAFVMALLLAVPANAEVFVESTERLVSEQIDVPPGGIVYRRLPLKSKAIISAEIATQGGLDNEIRVWFVDLPNFQLLQGGQKFAFVRKGSGTVSGQGQFTFTAAQANVYYLVLDNRESFTMRRTDVSVEKSTDEPTPEAEAVRAGFEELYGGLKKVFVFEDFDIHITSCGEANAYSTPDVVLCAELFSELHEQGVPGAALFVFFHELGHSLLNLWALPLHDNEDAADEFATVMMLLGDHEEEALEAAAWWAERATQQEAIAKLWADDRHSISPQRARNIVNWVNQGDALKLRWMKFLSPNMTATAQREFAEESKSWRPAPTASKQGLATRRIPIEVEFVPGSTIEGQVARIINTSGRRLSLKLVAENSALDQQVSGELELAPSRRPIEWGPDEGWHFVSGETLTIEGEGFDALKLTVP